MNLQDDIIKQLNNLLEGPLWLDEHFKKKLNQVDEQSAFRRPQEELHSVAELGSHLTVWINACLDRMQGIANGLKDNDPNDWKINELLVKDGWEKLKQDFYQAHQRLIAFVKTRDTAFLNAPYHTSAFTNKDIFFGLIQHNAYHLGQMGITIKLLNAKAI